jgi:hypothetical protein
MSIYNAEIQLISKRICGVVKKLSEIYSFDYNESLKFLSLDDYFIDDKTNRGSSSRGSSSRGSSGDKNSSIPLPFCGFINEECCKGIKLNHGLYTQCQSKPVNGEYCKICYNQTQKNSSSKPTYGHISDRLEGVVYDFRDPKGKKVVNYGNVMEKLNISREMAEEEAKKQGLEIPEKQFQVIRNQRGRPKKSKEVTVDDTDSEKSVPQEKKARGRPKKVAKEVKCNNSNNIIAELLAEANENNDSKNQETKKGFVELVDSELNDSDSDLDSESDDQDSNEINVTIFKFKGIDYFKTEENVLYDKDSNIIGKWNNIKKKIEFD